MAAHNQIAAYLAGPFAGRGEFADWRDELKGAIKHIRFHDPREDSDQYCSGSFTLGDLDKGVGGSNLVIAYNPKGNYWVDPFGMCIELGVAYGKRIPIVICDENDWIFPMLPPMARRFFTHFDMLCSYLEQLDHESSEFQSFYRAIISERTP